jgi:hypothetical protein
VDDDDNAPRGRPEVDDEAPPALVRGADRRNPPPPPAAGRAGRPVDEEEDPLPDGDKEKAPATEPAPGEIIPTSSVAHTATTTPAESKPREFQSTLGSALKARVAAHQNRPTTA